MSARICEHGRQLTICAVCAPAAEARMHRLSEIKARWNISPTSGGTAQFACANEDVRWLVAEVEQLRRLRPLT